MGYVKCRSCDGIGKKFFDRYDKSGRYYEKVVDCKACSGTGINQKFYSKNCEKCYAEIIYPRTANYPPKYCRDCKERIQAERERQAAKWKTKSCKKCHQTIKYNVEWNKIPELCKDCIAKEKAKWKEKKCKSCSATIKYNTDWQKIPELCPGCIKKERAKWKEKSCKGCGKTIKYNIDWKKIPELCKDCISKEKAKIKVKSCEACGRDVKYNTDWPRPPKFCRECANVLRILKGKEGVNKAKALEYFHRQPQIVQDGSRKTGNYVTVKSGYSRDYRKICSDFIVRDKGLRGVHYHIVIDIDGNIIMNECREDHD